MNEVMKHITGLYALVASAIDQSERSIMVDIKAIDELRRNTPHEVYGVNPPAAPPMDELMKETPASLSTDINVGDPGAPKPPEKDAAKASDKDGGKPAEKDAAKPADKGAGPTSVKP